MRRLATEWSVAPQAAALFAVLLLLAGSYLRGAHRLRRLERHWPLWRSSALLAGLATIEVAVASPLRLDARTSPPAQVTQTLLLLDVAPSLIALGAPLALLIESTRRPLRRRVGAVLGHRATRALTYPVVPLVCLVALSAADLAGPLGRSASSDPVVLGSVEMLLLVVGYLYWTVALGQDPLPCSPSHPARLLYLGVSIPPGSLIGIVLLDASRPALPGASVAATHVAGAVVWGFADLYTLGALALVFSWWMSAEDRAGEDRARALDPVLEAERIVAAAAERSPRHDADSSPDGAG